MKIAVDVYGGDNAPKAILDGCVQALENDAAMELIICGDENMLKDYFSSHGALTSRISVKHAPDIITNCENPTRAIKQKKQSSLVEALMCVAEKEAGAMVSAGSTGAVLAGATLIIRRLNGVKRPGLAPVLPTKTGCVLLIDCGANVESKPGYIVQFAIMGSAYMENVLKVDKPRIGLLNNGAEPEKGNDLTKEAYKLLSGINCINFAGNCEGRDALSGDFDVIVTDGFAGNVLLKNTEGTASLLMGMLKEELTKDFRSKLGALLAKPAFRRIKKRMDYSEYGGAPLLGVNGGIIKAHGSSNAKAFAAALRQAAAYIEGDVTNAIAKTIGQLEIEYE